MSAALEHQPRLSRLASWTACIMGIVALAATCLARAAESAAPTSASSAANQKLLQALDQGDLRQLESALAEGADPNCPGTNSLPPILELFRSATAPLDDDHRECLAALLEHGAVVDATDADRRTPLMQAARIGDLKSVRLLVETEAYVMARDRFHKSALFYAVEGNHRDIVLYLAANGDLLSLSVKERKARR